MSRAVSAGLIAWWVVGVGALSFAQRQGERTAVPSVGHPQSPSVLYNFGSAANDPLYPAYIGAVAQGRDGNLYTTAGSGGVDNGVCCGAVFKVTPAGSLETLYRFTGGSDGSAPQSGLTLGTDGTLYGTTLRGGASGFGTVFKITPQGVPTTLYSFTAGNDGAYPTAGVVEGLNGSFYGTTTEGGLASCDDGDGCGTIYKISSSGFSVVYQFDFTHGTDPTGLILGSDGDFYGTTGAGGANDLGTIFKMTSGGEITVLYNLEDNESVFAPLVEGSDGNFYGVTDTGGSHGHGAVFKMTPAGKFKILHSMSITADGEEPIGLARGNDGNFYGVNAYGGPTTESCPSTCGTLFEITPTGAFTVLYYFDGTHGMAPEVAPFEHTNGTLYADTEFGGTGSVSPCFADNPCGVFYSWVSPTLQPFVGLLPYAGKVGKTIEFLGQDFVKGQTTVSFNGTTATADVVSGTYLTATVPSGATTGPVTVTSPTGELVSNQSFRVTPQIIGFNPGSGPVGTPVTITGVSLTQTEKVTFGGVAAEFTVNSDTQVSTTVPSGAVTGTIKITTAGGSAVSSGVFTVTQ
ncbi:MAG TPA: choice-of-anchor tandem repeat GloVer-containing protein [Terriglobales bacterium]